MRLKTTGAALILALLGAAPAMAQAPPAIDEATVLFCKGDSGEIELMRYASLGTVMRRFGERFNFSATIAPDLTSMKFSNTETDFFISYETQPYRDEAGRSGLALLSMHISLQNIDETVKGTAMCYFSQQGK